VSGEGEVLVRGSTLFAGYVGDEGIEPSIDEQGWFHTRDQGSVGPCGELFVVGRADSQFISGGENIHPEMIEIALTSIAPIVAACVVPTPDEEFGSRPVAFVVCDGGELNQSNIKERLRSLLPSYAIPVEIHVAPHEMVSSSGKIQRRVALGLLQKS
jgi:O-succinylbenzoic acid--CoA ligase